MQSETIIDATKNIDVYLDDSESEGNIRIIVDREEHVTPEKYLLRASMDFYHLEFNAIVYVREYDLTSSKIREILHDNSKLYDTELKQYVDTKDDLSFDYLLDEVADLVRSEAKKAFALKAGHDAEPKVSTGTADITGLKDPAVTSVTVFHRDDHTTDVIGFIGAGSYNYNLIWHVNNRADRYDLSQIEKAVRDNIKIEYVSDLPLEPLTSKDLDIFNAVIEAMSKEVYDIIKTQ